MSGFVSIPIHILKTEDDEDEERHQIDDIKAVMGKCIQTPQPSVFVKEHEESIPRRRTIPIAIKTKVFNDQIVRVKFCIHNL